MAAAYAPKVPLLEAPKLMPFEIGFVEGVRFVSMDLARYGIQFARWSYVKESGEFIVSEVSPWDVFTPVSYYGDALLDLRDKPKA